MLKNTWYWSDLCKVSVKLRFEKDSPWRYKWNILLWVSLIHFKTVCWAGLLCDTSCNSAICLKCCGIFETGSVLPCSFLTATPASALLNRGCVAVSLLTYCSSRSWEEAWSWSFAQDGWDKLMSNLMVQLIEMKCFNSGILNHFIFKIKSVEIKYLALANVRFWR